ncbi:hypothetical protein BC936DRAFT_148120 [Jimgerdemannia flammicorona]|uniref:F-box domain-containing protein n=1 Tax=Jimgerdemannia flammicorona TaxID=994334 RepID=A0A433D3R4_9FUNG|nr:hypothetical protein BC936DRAFT_148120 [Jimgerdemannia flammicorona]
MAKHFSPPVLTVPTEIFLAIASFLTTGQLLRLAQVTKILRAVVFDAGPLWEDLDLKGMTRLTDENVRMGGDGGGDSGECLDRVCQALSVPLRNIKVNISPLLPISLSPPYHPVSSATSPLSLATASSSSTSPTQARTLPRMSSSPFSAPAQIYAPSTSATAPTPHSLLSPPSSSASPRSPIRPTSRTSKNLISSRTVASPNTSSATTKGSSKPFVRPLQPSLPPFTCKNVAPTPAAARTHHLKPTPTPHRKRTFINAITARAILLPSQLPAQTVAPIHGPTSASYASLSATGVSVSTASNVLAVTVT